VARVDKCSADTKFSKKIANWQLGHGGLEGIEEQGYYKVFEIMWIIAHT
jgi:hypothetical protein